MQDYLEILIFWKHQFIHTYLLWGY